MKTIPMLHLQRQQATIAAQLSHVVQDVMKDCSYISSEKVTPFEAKLAKYCNKPFALGVGSGTAALKIALLASGIQKGAEVITSPNSFYATSESILSIGATPVFADIDPDTHLMDISLLPALITEKTQAILPVHLYGNIVDVEQIQRLLTSMGRPEIQIIEDGAHSIGARLRNRPTPIGDCGIFSFNPGKNCGALGDAGAVVTSNAEVAEKVRLLRNHGRITKTEHVLIGFNSRLSRINDQVLNLKFDYLDTWNNQRRSIARQYDMAFREIDEVVALKTTTDGQHAYHQYVVQVENREALQHFLKSHGISTSIHYPVLIPDQPIMSHESRHANTLRVATETNQKIISLPCFPELQQDEIDWIIAHVKQFYRP